MATGVDTTSVDQTLTSGLWGPVDHGGVNQRRDGDPRGSGPAGRIGASAWIHRSVSGVGGGVAVWGGVLRSGGRGRWSGRVQISRGSRVGKDDPTGRKQGAVGVSRPLSLYCSRRLMASSSTWARLRGPWSVARKWLPMSSENAMRDRASMSPSSELNVRNCERR